MTERFDEKAFCGKKVVSLKILEIKFRKNADYELGIAKLNLV